MRGADNYIDKPTPAKLLPTRHAFATSAVYLHFTFRCKQKLSSVTLYKSAIRLIMQKRLHIKAVFGSTMVLESPPRKLNTLASLYDLNGH